MKDFDKAVSVHGFTYQNLVKIINIRITFRNQIISKDFHQTFQLPELTNFKNRRIYKKGFGKS